MIRNILIILYFLSFFAQASEKIIIPPNSQMKYIGDKENINLFNGTVKLKGLLRAYWGGEFKHKIIYFDFAPEKGDRRLLPYISDEYDREQIYIYLNDFIINKKAKNPENLFISYDDNINRSIIKKYFKNIPKSFWEYEEGMLTMPAVVKIKDFSTQVECDHRNYYAIIVEITPLEKTNSVTFPSSGCRGYGFEDNFTTFSKDGYVNLRQEPSTKANILMKLPENTSVTKIKTVADGNWYLVKLYESEETGYIHKSQLRIVE